MKSKQHSLKTNIELKKLSLSIGNFIRYWGFRRIHGAIWTQLYLTRSPMSCSDLVRNLGLSKALISPALEELCQHNLIEEVPSHNEKTKIYRAVSDFKGVIKNILKTREKIILEEINHDFFKLMSKGPAGDVLAQDRMQNLQDMILSANLLLELLLSQNEILQFPNNE